MKKTYQGPVKHKKIPKRKGIVVFYKPNEFDDITNYLKHHRIEVQSMLRRASGEYGIFGKQSSTTIVVITNLTAKELMKTIIYFLKYKLLPMGNQFVNSNRIRKGKRLFYGLISKRKNSKNYRTSRRVLNQFREYEPYDTIIVPQIEESEKKKSIKTYAYVSPAASFNFIGVTKVTSAAKLIYKSLYGMGYQNTYIKFQKKDK